MSKTPKKICVGCKVLLRLDGEEGEYIIVYPKDADVLNNKISTESPVGRAIFGKKEREKISVQIKGFKLSCEILKIE